MLPHYTDVGLYGSINRHIQEMPKAKRHARLKLSYEIRLLKLVVEKVLIWKSEHNLIN